MSSWIVCDGIASYLRPPSRLAPFRGWVGLSAGVGQVFWRAGGCSGAERRVDGVAGSEAPSEAGQAVVGYTGGTLSNWARPFCRGYALTFFGQLPL